MTPERRDGERFSRSGRPDEPGRSDQPRSGFLRRWPPVLWLLVYVGSIFILNGSNGQWDPLELVLGIGLAGVACALAVYLAVGPWPGRPRPRGTVPLIAGVFGFYAICALAAAIFAGPAEAIATVLAGVIPMTGAALWVATARAKTRPGPRKRDPAAADEDDPSPASAPTTRAPSATRPRPTTRSRPTTCPLGIPAATRPSVRRRSS